MVDRAALYEKYKQACMCLLKKFEEFLPTFSFQSWMVGLWLPSDEILKKF